MKKVIITGGFLIAMLAVPTMVQAQDTSAGTLTVTGTVASSITLTVETGAAGHTLTGAGTNAASANLGALSKYGTAPQGFTITPGASSWTLASTVGVKVLKANSISTAYTLNAKLGAAPAAGVVWSLGIVPILNDTTGQALTAAGVYGETASYPWTIEIPDALATTSAIDNIIEFSAIAG